jgi:Tfp pilus assembly PilM family ATPase
MAFSKYNKYAIGLDCGEEALKAVIIAKEGDNLRLRHVCFLSRTHEGLLDVSELAGALREAGNVVPALRKYPVVCGLDGDQVNAIVSYFPTVRQQSKLAKMVEYQISELCGLSGEEFCHDFQPFEDSNSNETPVLMAVCKSSVVNEHLTFCQSANLHCEQLTSNGLALLNAFAALHPNEANIPNELHGIVELGANHTLFGIYGAGRVHFLTAWQHNDSTEELYRSINAAITRWRESLNGGSARALKLKHLWLSGGGALKDGIEEELSTLSDIPTSLFGVPCELCPADNPAPRRNGLCPSLSVVFGLALQGLNRSAIKISLVPEIVAWQLLRRQHFVYLLLAAVILFGTLFAGNAVYSMYMKRAIQGLAVQEQKLDNCLRLYPKIASAYQEIANCQKKLIPIAESGFRAQRFMETLDSCQKARNESNGTKRNSRDWCIYLADEFSFAHDNTPPAKNESTATKASSSTTSEANSRTAVSSSAVSLPPLPIPAASPKASTSLTSAATSTAVVSSGATSASESTNTVTVPAVPTTATSEAQVVLKREQLPPITAVDNIPRLKAMYIGGLIPNEESSRYIPLKELQDRLNASNAFSGVDDYTDYLTKDFIGQYVTQWEQFVDANQQKLQLKCTFYFLQLPFSTTLIAN